MTTINQKLKITPEEYELLIFGAYARWCESVTVNIHEFQKVLANSSVSKWFMMEYSKCEIDFEHLTARYEENDTIITEDFKRCYAQCTYRLFNIRPTALLQEIKKTRAVNVLKVHGVKIPIITFNQN